MNELVLDLSDIGIPTTPNTFALRVEDDSMTGAGINAGDLVIMEKRQRDPRPGEIVAALVNQQVTLKRFNTDIDPGDIQGIAVGLIRKL